jgi:hypothetical protein
MKVSELRQIIESVISDEVKQTIISESENAQKEVYHIKCEGIPLGTYESQEDAEKDMDKFKKENPGKELIIEKGVYESHDDMLDKLDEMNDELEETDNMENTQKQPMEGNEFSGALKSAKDAGEKSFTVDGKEYDVEECWSKQMEEELVGGQKKLDKNHNGKIDGQDFKILKGQKSDTKEEEEECEECWNSEMKESVCEKCGKEVCECGGMMNESKKKKTLRLKESELVALIGRMVNESIPGLDAAKKAHVESGKENKENLSAVEKKISNAMGFTGNDNPEFPKAIGKGEKVARENTKEQDEEVAKNFAGLQNLDYDLEPSEQFKKRLKMALEGDTLMGNAPTTEKPSIKPSNGADKGKDAEEKSGNTIKTDTPKKLEKQAADRKVDKDNRELYPKQAVPVKSKNINEEVEKMKRMFNYNEKTQ